MRWIFCMQSGNMQENSPLGFILHLFCDPEDRISTVDPGGAMKKPIQSDCKRNGTLQIQLDIIYRNPKLLTFDFQEHRT